MKPDWTLIANATQARLLQQEQGAPMVVLHAFHHPEGRLKTSELGDSKAGRDTNSAGYGGAALPPRADAHRKEHQKFAHELAHYLEQAAQQGSFHKLEIFASNPFLGELKEQLGDATRRLVSAEHPVDLTAVGLAEIERRIAHERDAARA
jgi:protein required for attachment to host cells